jgi:cell division protein FtsL
MAAMTTELGMMGAAHSRNELIATRNRDLFEKQKRARRGPTPEVFFTKHIDNSRIVKADDPERRREMRNFAFAMTALFVLVMIYVGQHLKSIEIGYQIEAQKTQVEQLREQNRQYRLTEAQLTEPKRIDRLAKLLGMDVPQPGQVIRTDSLGSGQFAPVVASIASPPQTEN